MKFGNKSSYSNSSSLPFVVVFALFFGFSVGILFSFLFINKYDSNFKSSLDLSTHQRLYYDLTNYIDVRPISELLKIIHQNYINNVPDRNIFLDGIMRGIVNSLNDEYAIYMDKNETRLYNESRNPDFEGIGIRLRFNGENTEVESVLNGYPAEKSGILVGDVILKVNEEDMQGKSPSYVATKIRGKEGTLVNIEIMRNKDIIKFSVPRTKISVDNVNYKYLNDGIYLISIYQFIDETAFKFNASWDRVVENIKKEEIPIKGIIVDLRNNPGGFVFSVRYVLDEFVRNGEVILVEETKNSERKFYRANRDGYFEGLPIVVLVNNGTASASEIFAVALQELGIGKIIGQKTVGKGVEQQIYNIKYNESSLILPFQRWLSPKGVNISKDNPVIPDISIELDLENFFKLKKDNQLDEAITYLLNYKKD